MALRRLFGFSEGELMRSVSKPCSRLMGQTAGIFSAVGAFEVIYDQVLKMRLHKARALYCWRRNYWVHLRGSPACVGVESNGILILLTQSCLTNLIY
ncbi:hypothetical protein NC652_030463 [Populus alba x Populus x berolinensis]|nr:hypothetical protein NC652_030463 [Populus alba x Populus x berolinensis]